MKMDKVRISLALIVALVISWAMVATGTMTQNALDFGPLHVTLPYIIGFASLILLIHLYTPLLENFISIMMNSWVLKILLSLFILFGILAFIDIMLASLFGINIGVISWIKDLWGVM